MDVFLVQKDITSTRWRRLATNVPKAPSPKEATAWESTRASNAGQVQRDDGIGNLEHYEDKTRLEHPRPHHKHNTHKKTKALDTFLTPSFCCLMKQPESFIKNTAPHSGLVSHNGEHCYSACSWTDPETKKSYDFSALSGTHVVEGSRLFTASGTQYFHQVPDFFSSLQNKFLVWYECLQSPNTLYSEVGISVRYGFNYATRLIKKAALLYGKLSYWILK